MVLATINDRCFALLLQKAAYDYEHSELLLYQNMVIQEAGNSLAALEHLDKYQEQICDKVTLLETRAKYYMVNDRESEAEEIYRELLTRNPENHAYYHNLLDAMGAETEEQKLALYAEYREKYPKAQAPQRLPMDVAQGESKYPSAPQKRLSFP